MKRVFITGGSGTVGSKFIELYSGRYTICSFARNEKNQVALKRRFPEIEIYMGSVEDYFALQSAVEEFKPNIIIHAAAIKHVDTAFKQPRVAVNTNIVGSLNVIKVAKEANVRVTVAVSTDKACLPDSLYGQTKYIMEELFLEANSEANRFICCRFGNVAWSNGSVLPFWINKAKAGESLPLTDERMTRLMFLPEEAAKLLQYSIEYADENNQSTIVSALMKKVNMKKLAKMISKDIVIVGLRPGEKLYENLISKEEASRAIVQDGYILIHKQLVLANEAVLVNKLDSVNAEEMSKAEMHAIINAVHIKGSETALELKEY